MIVLPDTLKDHIVLFHLFSSIFSSMDGSHVIQVSEIESEYVYGRLIASELSLSLILHTQDTTRIWRTYITSYEILTVRDLPLLIGYKYTSELLAELIKGG